MPVAAPLAAILDVETELEAALYRYYLAEYSLAAYTSDSNEVLPTPRIEIVVTVNEQGTHRGIISSGTYAGRYIWDFWRVTIQMDLVYSPERGQAQGTLRGQLRQGLTDLPGIQAELDTNGFLLIAQDSFRQIGGSREINDQENIARVNTSVEAIIQINPDALAIAT